MDLTALGYVGTGDMFLEQRRDVNIDQNLRTMFPTPRIHTSVFRSMKDLHCLTVHTIQS